MKSKEAITISDFARLSRTTRRTLIFYDEIGLLHPDARGKNGFRYYSYKQLASVNLIRTCQELGMSLDEIKELIVRRSPEIMDELLIQQIGRIDEKISEWIRARKLLTVMNQTIHAARHVDMGAINVEALPAQAIILGGLNDYSQGRDDYDALLDFYLTFSKKYPDMDLNYPVWGVFSEDRVRRGDMTWPDRYYFNNPEGYDRKQAGLYAIGYCNGEYGELKSLNLRLMTYADDHGYEVCGPAYAEYPLNEICVLNPSDYLIRMMITVKKK